MDLYLNHADGRKPKLLAEHKAKNPELAYRNMVSEIRKMLFLPEKDFLGFSQNATTSLIYALTPILQKGDFDIYVSSHEIRWFGDLFREGKLPTKDTTFPNYVQQIKIPFIKWEIKIFDPVEFVKNPKKIIGTKKPAIIILSHVSRMTGELFVTPALYKKVKAIQKDAVFVVDGTQAVGALVSKPKTLSDIYLGVTSKFIGAELHIGFCWVRQQLSNLHMLKEWHIDPQNFSREIYSTLESIKKSKKVKGDIKKVREYFDKKLKGLGVDVLRVKNQVRYIALISVKKQNPSGVVQKLKDIGIVVSSNTKYSVTEPEVPSIRVSLTPGLSRKQIDYFAENISVIK